MQKFTIHIHTLDEYQTTVEANSVEEARRLAAIKWEDKGVDGFRYIACREFDLCVEESE